MTMRITISVFRAFALAAALLGVTVLARAPGGAAGSPSVASGFRLETIAHVAGARELAVAPNGDLFVGTYGSSVYVVPDAEGTPGEPKLFARVGDAPAAGVFLTGDALYVGGQFGVYRIPYRSGDRTARASPEKIGSVRTSGEARDHRTTTVAVTKGKLYASVGSSCNACSPELDPTRATIQEMDLDGKAMHPRAVDIRNAIALAVQPGDGDLWAGVAGRDDLEHGHPYEIFDDVSSHGGTPDYGWLKCYDDRRPIGNASCANVVVPKIVFPAYITPIGAAFYPTDGKGRYAFPAAYRGGAFVTLHGSWHTPLVAPRVAFVPFNGANPAKSIDWTNPNAQWRDFLGGCQAPNEARLCRPTGVAVGPDGSLFVSDDANGTIWRIRPAAR
jgi:glucose/arabinose dehydrogenase